MDLEIPAAKPGTPATVSRKMHLFILLYNWGCKAHVRINQIFGKNLRNVAL